MIVLGIAALSATAGLALWQAWQAAFPKPAPLAEVLAAARRPGQPLAAEDGHSASSWRDRVGDAAVWLADLAGMWTSASDLQLARRTRRQQAVQKILWALVGAAIPLVWAAAGVGFGPVGTAGAAAAGAAAGWLVADRRVRTEAEEQRRQLRYQLASWLDLVVVIIAGGAQPQAALHAAASAGEGRLFELVRDQLRDAQLANRRPSEAFRALGEQLQIDELRELAASLALASGGGAPLRDTLTARADSLRARQLAETQAAAEAATEAMNRPLALMAAGWLLAAIYPALARLGGIATTGATSLP